MKSHFLIRIWLVLLLLSVACSKEVADTMLSAASSDFNFLKNTQSSNEANQLRSVDYSAPFEISRIVRNKEVILVTVTYLSGCEKDRFDLIWNGLALTTAPESVVFYLRRTAACGSAGTSLTRILTIRLTDCLGDASLAQRVNVVLCNASKKANTENADFIIAGN